jgi:hypothetical protein
MCRTFNGNMFSRNVELTREGTGASKDNTNNTMYIQARRYESNPRSRV